MDSLPARLAQASPTGIGGTRQRHVAARFADNALAGRSATGRWGTEGSYPVLYLGRPTDSVAVEAYRHLVDPVAATYGHGNVDAATARSPKSTAAQGFTVNRMMRCR
jgi:hypothetical protein